MSNKNCQDCVTICCDGICPPAPLSKGNVQKSRQDKPPPPRKQEHLPVRKCLLERPNEPIVTKYGPTSGVKPIVRKNISSFIFHISEIHIIISVKQVLIK